MRSINAAGQEKRFRKLSLKLPDHPVDRFEIPCFFIRNLYGRPVEISVHIGKGGHVDRLAGFWVVITGHMPFLGGEIVIPRPGIWHVVMEDLAGAGGPVAVIGKILRQSDGFGQNFSPVLVVGIHARVISLKYLHRPLSPPRQVYG